VNEWAPWAQPVVVYHDNGSEEAAAAMLIGGVIGLTFALLLLTARVLIWVAVHGAPLLVWLAVAGTRALHDAAAGRLLDEPAGVVSRRRDAVLSGGLP
jgi:hypothetical protein